VTGVVDAPNRSTRAAEEDSTAVCRVANHRRPPHRYRGRRDRQASVDERAAGRPVRRSSGRVARGTRRRHPGDGPGSGTRSGGSWAPTNGDRGRIYLKGKIESSELED